MSVCGIRYGESRPTRDNKVRPDRGALESDAFNVQIGSILSVKENRTKEGVVWVLVLLEFICHHAWKGVKTYQNLKAGKAIIPSLAIPVQNTSTENLDVLASPLPKCDRLLERMVKVIVLPISDVVGELSIQSVSNLQFDQFPGRTKIFPSSCT